jgi:hypothetical protein
MAEALRGTAPRGAKETISLTVIALSANLSGAARNLFLLFWIPFHLAKEA